MYAFDPLTSKFCNYYRLIGKITARQSQIPAQPFINSRIQLADMIANKIFIETYNICFIKSQVACGIASGYKCCQACTDQVI